MGEKLREEKGWLRVVMEVNRDRDVDQVDQVDETKILTRSFTWNWRSNDSGKNKKNERYLTRLDLTSARQRGYIRRFEDKI